MEDKKFIEKLQGIVEGCRGLVSWAITGHKRENIPGTNWVIIPTRVKKDEVMARKEDMPASKFLALYQPQLSEQEYDDVEGLTAWIKNELSK